MCHTRCLVGVSPHHFTFGAKTKHVSAVQFLLCLQQIQKAWHFLWRWVANATFICIKQLTDDGIPTSDFALPLKLSPLEAEHLVSLYLLCPTPPSITAHTHFPFFLTSGPVKPLTVVEMEGAWPHGVFFCIHLCASLSFLSAFKSVLSWVWLTLCDSLHALFKLAVSKALQDTPCLIGHPLRSAHCVWQLWIGKCHADLLINDNHNWFILIAKKDEKSCAAERRCIDERLRVPMITGVLACLISVHEGHS